MKITALRLSVFALNILTAVLTFAVSLVAVPLGLLVMLEEDQEHRLQAARSMAPNYPGSHQEAASASRNSAPL